MIWRKSLKFIYKTLLFPFFFFILFTKDSNTQSWVAVRDTATFIRQTGTMRLMMNSNGFLGAHSFPSDSARLYYDPRAFPPFEYVPQVGLEYPVGSKNEHLIAGGLWIGAIINTHEGKKYAVTTTVSRGYETETLGHAFESDTFFRASIFDTDKPTRRFFDDDRDGFIDEDEFDGIDNDSDWVRVRDDLNRNGRPDHGEPNVDEDAGAISESDLYVVYRDSFAWPRWNNHINLGITIVQRSFAWKTVIKEPILVFEYYIINSSYKILDSVYLGFYARIFLGPYFPIDRLLNTSVPRIYDLGYMPEVQTAYSYANIPGLPKVTPFGITLLGTSPKLTTPRLTYRFLNPLLISPDSEKYKIMSNGTIQRDTTTGRVTYYPEQLLSIGPFLNFRPRDTLKFAIALVSGENLNAGYNNVLENAQKAHELYTRAFLPANLPPSPPLRFTMLKNGVQLNWKWYPGDPRFDPEETWETDNKYIEALPDTHWRKRNPPTTSKHGGRIFEGYKIWRSEYPIYQENVFSIIRQFDVADDLFFNGQTGIEYTYIDTPLVRGKKYWYAVTTFTIPNYFVTIDTASGGQQYFDTTLTPPIESPLFQNVKAFQLPFKPSEQLGQVMVVPNPYRTDRTYTFEEGGWEGLGRLWHEGKRQIWFTHLPPKATIRIFTIMGESIATIHHNDEIRKAKGLPIGQEEWELLSDSHRTIASGIYIFTVESELGTQTGKFVVIK